MQRALTDLLKVTIDLPAWEEDSHGHNSAVTKLARACTGSTDNRSKREIPRGVRGTGTPPAEPLIPSPTETSRDGTERCADDRRTTVGSNDLTTDGNNPSDTVGKAAERNTIMRDEGGNDAAAASSAGKPTDTGLWTLLYKGSYIPFPIASFGSDLSLKGIQIPKPARGKSAPGAAVVNGNTPSPGLS